MIHSEFYGDVSYAFNLPALETLILDSSSFEVKFDRLQDNPALKALSLNHVKLYKNIEMWSVLLITMMCFSMNIPHF